ncbi:MAG: hypothetical protein AAF467_21380 [Actinomycetota bacterium]
MSKGDNNNSNNGGRRPKRRRKSGAKKPKISTDELWGNADKLPDREALRVKVTSDPSAVVRSLGRPPLSGHHGIAEHYFAAVYDRSVGLASALAAAGDLLDDGPDTTE